MTSDRTVEQRLAHEATRWKWLRFLTHSAVLGTAVACLALLFGLFVRLGWVQARGPALLSLGVLAVVATAAWVAIARAAVRSRLSKTRLARLIERGCPSLMDRLNALAFLEGRRGDPNVEGLYRRIESQAHTVLTEEHPPSASSPVLAVICLAIFALLTAATILFYTRLRPLQALQPRLPKAAAIELPVADEERAARDKTTVEVRITEPGRDVTVTRVETVPLRIEAVASKPLDRVEWYTAVNGGEEKQRDLPAPPQPNRAVYEPVIDVQDLGLKAWDVLAYYAQAVAEDGSSAVSDLYFVHVQPFQEELGKLPGGEQGEHHDMLSELTNLVRQQESVIREAHRQLHDPDQRPKERQAKLEELAERERELADATCHSGARISAEVGEQQAEQAASHLANAENALHDAAEAFDNSATPDAEREARSALSELTAAQTELQKCMSGAEPTARDRGDSPQDVTEALAEMARSREQAEGLCKSARELADRQRQLADEARKQNRATYPRLAEAQEQLRDQLAQLQKQNPGACQQAQKQCSAANKATNAASKALRSGSRQAPQRAQEAAEALENLAGALQKQARDEQMGEAYRLKRMLDQQREQLQNLAERSEAPERQELEQCAKNVKETTRQLKSAAEKPPTKECFGTQLGESLSDEKKRDLDSQCESMCNKPGAGASKQAARQMAERLSEIGQAFSQSRPEPLAQPRNALRPEGEEAMERGLRQARRLAEPGRPDERESRLSREDRDRLRREASRNLERAARDQQHSDSGTDEVGSALRRELENETPSGSVDEAVLRQLVSQLEALRVERARSADEREDREWDIEHVDPSRLPPTYRDRIQRYYEKLSEQK